MIIAIAWVMSAWPFFWQVEKLLDGGGTTRHVIATMLAILGSIVLAVGAFVGALEARSKMRERRKIALTADGTRALGVDVKAIGDALAAALDAFGKLPRRPCCSRPRSACSAARRRSPGRSWRVASAT